MRMLSIRGTDFIAHWAYEERISAHAQPAVKCEQLLHVHCTIHAEHTQNEFYRTLSIRGTNFIACWAYAEPISSHAEHARKVKYLDRIEYDFQKSRVTGPWDHMVSASLYCRCLEGCQSSGSLADLFIILTSSNKCMAYLTYMLLL
jgi:hypothetical protein